MLLKTARIDRRGFQCKVGAPVVLLASAFRWVSEGARSARKPEARAHRASCQQASKPTRTPPCLQIVDFGLSRMLSHEETHAHTASYGTPSHAAPELLGEGKLSKAADVYRCAACAAQAALPWGALRPPLRPLSRDSWRCSD